MNINKVLLLGATGQLGLELQKTAPNDIKLITLSHNDLNITDYNELNIICNLHEPDIIINAAAYTNVDLAETYPDKAFAINCSGASNCAKVAYNNSIRLIHISTDYVFDGTKPTPYTVDDNVSPINVYGKSKAAGESEVIKILKDKALIIRTAWLYSSYNKNFVKTMLKLMSTKNSLNIVSDQIGTPTWANGLASFIWKVCDKTDFSGIQHWTDSGLASWYDFAVAIQEEALSNKLLNNSIIINNVYSKYYKTKANRPSCVVLDKTSSYSLFGNALHWRTSLRLMLNELLFLKDSNHGL